MTTLLIRAAHSFETGRPSPLDGLELLLPRELPERTHIYHQFTIQSDRRDQIRAALRAEGIASAVYYPVPLHRQEALRKFATAALPVAERAAERVLSLPMYPELTGADVERICSVVRRAL